MERKETVHGKLEGGGGEMRLGRENKESKGRFS